MDVLWLLNGATRLAFSCEQKKMHVRNDVTLSGCSGGVACLWLLLCLLSLHGMLCSSAGTVPVQSNYVDVQLTQETTARGEAGRHATPRHATPHMPPMTPNDLLQGYANSIGGGGVRVPWGV
jgi:hypothetical protein